MKRESSPAKAVIQRAFGAANRQKLLQEWFQGAGIPTPDDAWRHVYRLLQWIDRSTGLAHCYESDKSQPGRHWYARSLAFHAWLASQFGVSPKELTGEVDWLFKRAIDDLAFAVEQRREKLLDLAAVQRGRFDAEFPEPGDDPELFEIITRELQPFLKQKIPEEFLREFTQKITIHLGQENKRKNLIGEGFEDVLAELVRRMEGMGGYDVLTRVKLHELPGFNPPRASDKVKKVDLAIVSKDGESRHLISAKWSIRADREEQLATDFLEYERLEAAGRGFEYIVITNEFDPARLYAACNRRSGNKLLFSNVVHVNPAGVLSAYGEEPIRSAAEVKSMTENGRLSSLMSWLGSLVTP